MGSAKVGEVYVFTFLEDERDFLHGIIHAIGAMHGVALDVFGELLTDGPRGGVGWIGGTHDIAVLRHSVFAFENLQDDRP